jgi:hypothetical protein
LTKQPISHRHHYVPEFYLAGFTASGEKDDFLFVFDKDKKKQWKSKPNSIAFEHDYYRFDFKGLGPDYIEKNFAIFESKASKVIK